ncbi:MAG: hypothetical protein HPY76_08810 [Anaerolineae bacterium]|nr:hypothetical protein [Anaerolineae bacterium]
MPRSLRIILFLLLLGVLLPAPARAQTVPTPTWMTYIAYYNPRTEIPETPDRMTVVYYKPDGSDIPTNIDLPFGGGPHISGRVFVGNTLHNPGFRGSVVISSTSPVVAMYREIAEGEDAFSPILYNSFSVLDAGGGKFYIPFVQKSGAFDPMIGIQNVESVPITVELTFYPAGGGAIDIDEPFRDIEAQASAVYLGSELGLGATFEGAMVVEAIIKDSVPAEPGRIVAAVRQAQSGGRRAFAYEGFSGGAGAVFMPAAMCNVGTGGMTVYYEVQNTGEASTEVEVDYYNTNPAEPPGNLIATQTLGSLAPGSRLQVDPCQVDGMNGRSVSAVIRASSPDGQVAAVGRAVSQDGLMTAFSGQIMMDPDMYGFGCTASDPEYPDNCTYRVIVPYVEYSTRSTGWRTYLSIQNILNIPEKPEVNYAANIQVRYYGQDGSLIGTHYLATDENDNTRLMPYAKRSSDPTFANVIDPSSQGFIGAVEVVSDRPVAVLARIQRPVSVPNYALVGEDYTGMYLINEE